MPDSSPNNVFIDPNGNIQTEFVGHFEGVFGGPRPSIVMEPFQPASGQVFAPEFDPAYSGITFMPPPDPDAVLRVHPFIAAAIWASTPDQINPPTDPVSLLDQLLIRAGSKTATLLREDGYSDFASRAGFTNLPIVNANTTRGGNAVIAGWNWLPTASGRYMLCVTGSGFLAATGVGNYTTTVNGVAVGGGNLTFNQVNAHQCLVPQFGVFTVPNPPTLQNIQAKASALNTDNGFDWYNGFVTPLP